MARRLDPIRDDLAASLAFRTAPPGRETEASSAGGAMPRETCTRAVPAHRPAHDRGALSPSWIVLLCLLALTGCGPASQTEAIPWLPGNACAFRPTGARTTSAEVAGSLPVTVVRPDGSGPFPFVVLLHGCDGIRRQGWARWAQPWAELFRAHGIGAAVVDSFTPRGVDQVCTRDVAAWAVRRADNAESVRAWLAAQPFADRGRIAVMGMSNGGRTVLAALRAGSPHSGRFAAGVALYPGCQSDEGSTFRAPLLVLIGRADTVTPAAFCERMRDAQPASAPEVRLVVYPRAPHTFDVDLPDRTYLGMRLGFDGPAAADARRRVLEFLAEHGVAPRRGP